MISWLFVGLVAALLLTPGPTNTLLASSGIQMGLKRSLQLIPAEAIGYIIAISAWGMMIDHLGKTFSLLPTLLKLISAFYIVYLAIKLWRSADLKFDLNQPSIRPRELFCATLLNPKALLFASAIFPENAWMDIKIFLIHMMLFLCLILPIAMFWIFIGSVLASNKVSWLNACNLQRTASLVLVSFSIPLSYSAILKF